MSKIEKFSREYHIRSYECNKYRKLRLVTLMNIFQDMADSHASALGLGMDFCLAHGLTWVGSNYHIKIQRMPQIHENIKIMSWPSEQKTLGAIRDFEVLGADNKQIICAASQWVLLNTSTKRPVLLKEHLPQYAILDEQVMPSNFEKIPEPTHCNLSLDFKVRHDDIDFNGHVNNAIYPLWASEALPLEWLMHKEIAEIEIAFRKEGLFGETVRVITELLSECNISIHKIISTTDERELARVRFNWREI